MAATTPTHGTIKSRGVVYVGDILKNQPHGKGKLQFDDGEVYEGHFKFGRADGYGVESFQGDVYSGEWVEGKKCGKGTLKTALGDEYVGSWAEDEMEGEGVYTFASGAKYTGPFVAGKRHGFGTLECPNGVVFAGGWARDRRSGRGSILFADGSGAEGVWRDGVCRELHRTGSGVGECTDSAAGYARDSCCENVPLAVDVNALGDGGVVDVDGDTVMGDDVGGLSESANYELTEEPPWAVTGFDAKSVLVPLSVRRDVESRYGMSTS